MRRNNVHCVDQLCDDNGMSGGQIIHLLLFRSKYLAKRKKNKTMVSSSVVLLTTHHSISLLIQENAEHFNQQNLSLYPLAQFTVVSWKDLAKDYFFTITF